MVSLLTRVWKHKMLLIMRLTFSICLFCVLQSFAIGTFSQNVRLSINQKNISVENALQLIEDKTDYYFMYSVLVVDVKRTVDIEATNKLVPEILEDILKGTDISYKIDGRLIALSKNGDISSETQQQKTVSGKVTDFTGTPLPGVSVVIKGTTTGAITDSNGNYSLSNVPGNSILQFSFIGMKKMDVKLEGKTTINVTLEEETVGIEEVVAIGYGTKKKRDLTGSISSVSGNNLTETKTESFAQALQGRSAGVLVKSNSGQPGGGVSIRIRGIGGINDSEPLYIIDGIQFGVGGSDTNNPLSSLNPNDIESLEVLKDASSSAIYGARGANGVVLITTKRGKEAKSQITYTTSYGIQNMTNPNKLQVMNGQEYAEWVNKVEANDGKPAIFGGTNTTVYPTQYFPSPSQIGVGTNWLDLISRNNASVQDHQLTVSGGKQDHQYFLSASYFDQNGIIKTSSFKRYSIRLNTDNKLNNWLKVGNSFYVAHSKQLGIDVDRSFGGAVISPALLTPPTLSVTNSDGSFAGPPTAFYAPYRTPYSVLMNNYNETRGTNLMGNIYGNVQLLKGLSFRTNISVVMGFNSTEHFIPKYTEGIAKSAVTEEKYVSSISSNWQWNNVISYDKMLGKHHLGALGGMESSEGKYVDIGGQSAFDENLIRVVRSSGASTSNFGQLKTAQSLISYFGNFSYNYDEKYYLEGNIRRDGSSQFGINSRWGTFPSVSTAWRISKEHFFPKDLVDDFKIRASYGEVGNNKIGNFAFIAPVKTVMYSMSGNNGQFNIGTVINQMANPDIKWETSKQVSVGIDASLFSNKLTIAADYFQTNVEDMLLGITIPAFTGISFSDSQIKSGTMITNIGSLQNQGFEFEVSYKGKSGDLNYSVNANLSTYNNKVTDIGRNDQIWGQTYRGQNISRTVKGGSLGEFYGYVVDGIFQTQEEVVAANSIDKDPLTPYQNALTAPGDYKYKDLDGDGVVNSKDRTKIGSPIPDFTYGMGFNLGYKNFELTGLFVGSQGNEIFLASRIDLESSSLRNNNKSKVMLNSWNGAGSTNTVARTISSDPNQNSRISSKFVEDGSYLRVRNVQLSYNIPSTLIQKMGISKAQIYLSGQNLFTITKYSGFDPEVGNLNGSNLSAGIDSDIYPQAKSIHIGASISF